MATKWERQSKKEDESIKRHPKYSLIKWILISLVVVPGCIVALIFFIPCAPAAFQSFIGGIGWLIAVFMLAAMPFGAIGRVIDCIKALRH